MNDVVFYNMWGRERYQDYINLPFKYKEEHEWVTDLQKNNAYFLDHINEYASGPQKADYALTGFLDWYVKKRAANDGDAEYKREYYADWLNHTIFICDHKPGYEWVVDWCRRYLITMNITKDGNSVLTETKMWNNGRTGTFHAFPQDGGYYAYFLDTMNPGSWLAVENRIASGLIAYAINYLELNECNIYTETLYSSYYDEQKRIYEQGHFHNDIDDGTFAIYLYKQEKSLYDQNVIGEFLSEVDRKEVKMIFDHFVVQYCQQSDSKIGNMISSIEEHAHFSVQWSYEQANRILEALQNEGFISTNTTIEVFYYRMTGRGKASDNKIEWVKRGKRRKKDISKSGLLDFVYLAQGKECDAPTRIFPRIFQINKLCDTTYTRFKADVGSEYRIELEGIMKS